MVCFRVKNKILRCVSERRTGTAVGSTTIPHCRPHPHHGQGQRLLLHPTTNGGGGGGCGWHRRWNPLSDGGAGCLHGSGERGCDEREKLWGDRVRTQRDDMLTRSHTRSFVSRFVSPACVLVAVRRQGSNLERRHADSVAHWSFVSLVHWPCV